MNIARFPRSLVLVLLSGAALAGDPVKVVYNFNEGQEQARRGLLYINNHLTADPSAKIVVVAHAAGIDFLLKGTGTGKGSAFDAVIGDFSLNGVEFRVCNITLQSRGIDPVRVHGDATIVPSGVAEVARLQAKEGFVYLKP